MSAVRSLDRDLAVRELGTSVCYAKAQGASKGRFGVIGYCTGTAWPW